MVYLIPYLSSYKLPPAPTPNTHTHTHLDKPTFLLTQTIFPKQIFYGFSVQKFCNFMGFQCHRQVTIFCLVQDYGF